MTSTFENDNDVIVYALETVIDYTRKNQYIFVAQSVWWIASIIGLTEELVTHIDTLCVRSEVHQGLLPAHRTTILDGETLPKTRGIVNPTVINRLSKEVSAKPRDLQKDSSIDSSSGYIHPDRISRVHNTIQGNNNSEPSGSDQDQTLRLKETTEKFISDSWKERKAVTKKPGP